MSRETRYLRVYISTGSANYQAARVFLLELSVAANRVYPEVNVVLAYDWMSRAEAAYSSPEGLEDYRMSRCRYGEQMLQSIDLADFMVVLPGGGQGTYTEAGVFLGLNRFGGRKAARPIFLVETDDMEYALSPFYNAADEQYIVNCSPEKQADYIMRALRRSHNELGLLR